MKKIIFILVVSLISTNYLNAQKGANSALAEKKEQIYKIKRDKSPAKELILESDKNIERANELRHKIKGFDDYSKLAAYFETYNKVVASKQQILDKDPKWKTTKIDEFVTDHETFHADCLKKQKDFEAIESQFKALETFFESKEKLYWNSYQNIDDRPFFDFVSGNEEADFQWTLIQSKIEEAKSTSNAYKKALGERNLNSTFSMKGLEFFTSDMRLKQEAKDFVKEEGDVFKNEDMTKFSAYRKSKLMLDKAKAFYFLYPDMAELKTVKDKYQSTFDELDKKYSVMATSPFHKAHMGEFFFSNHLVAIGSETDSDFKTNFKAGEPIYVTYYGYRNYEKGDSKTIRLEKDGNVLVEDSPIIIGPNEQAKTVFQFALIPESTNSQISDVNKITISPYIKALLKLGAGQHNLALRMGKYQSNPVKNFTVDLTGQQENLTKLNNEIETLIFNFIRMPKPGMSDPQLIGIVQEGFRADGENHNVLETIIISDRWIINRHAITNEEVSRELMDVVIICKDDKGCYMLIAHVSRDKKESGGYEPATISYRKTYPMTDNIWFSVDEDYKLYFNCDHR
ncbi:MAG: hypothetical protein ACWA41_06590 [Putridiphycobacter sp.]